LNLQRLLDRVSIWASGACIVHCLAMPALLVLLPVLASTTLSDPEFHAVMLVWIVPFSLLALYLGCRRHKDRRVLALGLLGLAVLAATSVLGHDLLGETGEKVATVLGGGILIAGHYRNHRLCRSQHCDG
jgi:hypothetical protein